MEEHNRLLYVALTRAEDRLVVCGWQTRRGLDDACWYRLVERGFDALPAERATFEPGTARCGATPRRSVREPEPRAGEAAERRSPSCRAGPARRPIGTPHRRRAKPARPERLAPSRPENAELGPVPAAASPLAAREAAGNRFRRGHADPRAAAAPARVCPPERRAAAARAWLDRPGNGLAAGEAETLARETLAILDHPDLAPLFGPGSRAEVPLTGVVGGSVVGGLVDRLAVLPDRVLIADYKTNRRPPRADRGHAGAVPAPDGRLSRRAARHLPRPRQSSARWSGPRRRRSSSCRTSCLESARPRVAHLNLPTEPIEAEMSANTKPVTDQTFSTDVLKAEGPVLVDFWAEWCGPCKMIGPALEELAGEFAGKLTVAKVNIDDNPVTPNNYAVRGIPTLILFKNGQPAATQVGALPKSRLKDWISANI